MRSVYFSFFPSLPLPPSDPHIRELFRLFASVRGRKEAELLLRDILTPRELQDVAERWQIVKALHRGTPQRAIAEELGTSLATVTRGSRMLQYGGGGFVRFLRKMKKRTKD